MKDRINKLKQFAYTTQNRFILMKSTEFQHLCKAVKNKYQDRPIKISGTREVCHCPHCEGLVRVYFYESQDRDIILESKRYCGGRKSIFNLDIDIWFKMCEELDTKQTKVPRKRENLHFRKSFSYDRIIEKISEMPGAPMKRVVGELLRESYPAFSSIKVTRIITSTDHYDDESRIVKTVYEGEYTLDPIFSLRKSIFAFEKLNEAMQGVDDSKDDEYNCDFETSDAGVVVILDDYEKP